MIDCEGSFEGGATYCEQCQFDNIYKCTSCNAVYCDKCSKRSDCGEDECEVVFCNDCYVYSEDAPECCKKCNYSSCKTHLWDNYQLELKENLYCIRECEGCQVRLFPMIEEQNEKLSKEVEELKEKLASASL